VRHFGIAVVAILAAICTWAAPCAETAAIDVQAVNASDPGKKDPVVPVTLAKYKGLLLKRTVFGTFADAGCKSLRLAASAKDTATVGGYDVELTLASTAGGKAKVDIAIKQGGKPIGIQPGRVLSEGDPITVEVGSPKAPTILIIALKEKE
jgi:hypothetical protein